MGANNFVQISVVHATAFSFILSTIQITKIIINVNLVSIISIGIITLEYYIIITTLYTSNFLIFLKMSQTFIICFINSHNLSVRNKQSRSFKSLFIKNNNANVVNKIDLYT